MSEQLSKEQAQRLALQNSSVDKASYYQAMENNRIFQSQIEQMSEKMKQMQNEILMVSTIKKQKADLEEQVGKMAEQIK